ncbi:MAG TPA: DUF5808 domain-containing protein [Pseudogracilibacillus sp.]|nr:DUF5808 domain-containing protein [Pseudogracilibacillus sp.]
MNSSLLFSFGLFVFTGLILSFMPYFTRRTESFGVSIPEVYYERKELKKMRSRYSKIMLATLVLLLMILLLIFYFTPETVFYISFTVLLIVYLITSFLIYLPFHYQMKRIKKEKNWQAEFTEETVVDLSFRNEKITLSRWFYVIPFFITVATIVYTFSIYDSIPDQVWRHISFSGEITYTDKTPGTLLHLPIMQLFMIGTFLIIDYVISQSKQQLSPAKPEISKKQNILFRRRWSIFLFIMGTLVVVMFSFMQLSIIHESLIPYLDPVNYTIIGIILVGTIWLSIRTGQGGSRIKVKGEEEALKMERDEDRYWKLGQFYFNKDDPSIFVEKRFGVGWTNNWAHPLSWILLIILIGTPILIIILLQNL